MNLTRTSAVIDRMIRDARLEGRKAICNTSPASSENLFRDGFEGP